MVWNSQNQPLAHMAFQTTPTTSQAPTHQLLLPVALPLEVLIPPKISQILRLVLWDITTIWKITLQASGASQALQLTAMSLKLITILLTQSQLRLHWPVRHKSCPLTVLTAGKISALSSVLDTLARAIPTPWLSTKPNQPSLQLTFKESIARPLIHYLIPPLEAKPLSKSLLHSPNLKMAKLSTKPLRRKPLSPPPSRNVNLQVIYHFNLDISGSNVSGKNVVSEQQSLTPKNVNPLEAFTNMVERVSNDVSESVLKMEWLTILRAKFY